MSKTFDQGKEEVARLCQYFATNRQAFHAPGVKEAHIRQSLIDPLFESLGWDVRNTAMTAPQYREVIPEDSLDVEGQQKAPDYTFRVGTLSKFYAEAKKCGVNISGDPAPAYQLRRYGWSAKLALSVLTDFEELGVYDCTARPRPSDNASHARIQYFRFDEYPDRWRELWDVFSREAVWSGAFDQYAASKRKRGTSEVDVEFLKEIEGWRLALAGNIALRNKDLSLDDLNAAVQLTIDRVVFLRMAEDRGLEPYEQLLKLCERPDIYPRFMRDLCRQADEKYNSGLFHFQKESGVSEDPDRITPKLAVDDKVLKSILQSLYFAHGSPYHFGVMPVEILGTVYERFLGKVIRLTAGHQAKIEEKPEVRKAGGVYYTPAYIVEYIVKHTVGRQIEGRSPAQLAGSAGVPAGSSGRRDGGGTFRVLDMACGSGSFLLGAYQCLLDYFLNWYIEHKPEKFKKAVYKGPRNGHWRLTIEERKRILTTHIFGVDIDLQAVEVTKLSLLLKVLEGETDQSLSLSQLAFGDRALPNLADNIKCGNSLIGPDYFTGKLITDPEEMKRVNAFDWKQGFPDAMKAGGFDCIIGNPPYIRSQALGDEQRRYFQQHYRTATATYDIYVLFVEGALSVLNENGRSGFILPNKFFSTDYGAGLRKLVTTPNLIDRIVDFEDARVFAEAGNYTCLLFLRLDSPKHVEYVRLGSVYRNEGAEGLARSLQTQDLKFERIQLGVGPARWTLAVGAFGQVLVRLQRELPTMSLLEPHIFQGLKTSADKVYLLEVRHKKGGLCQVQTAHGEQFHIEAAILRPVVKGEHVQRYWIDLSAGLHIIYPYEVLENGRAALLDSGTLAQRFPRAWEYLKENKKVLGARDKGLWAKRPDWYAYARSQNIGTFVGSKLLIPYMTTRLRVAPDPEGHLFFVNITTGGYGARMNYGRHHPHYVAGLLNSRLLDQAVQQMTNAFRGGYFAVNKQAVERLPLRPVDFSDPADKGRHDKMVTLVNSMLALYKQLTAAKSGAQKAITQRQIDATDAEIDNLVYELYGITDEERKIIEAKEG